MNRRIENGEIGGGKRGKYTSKEDFIKNDYENFSMKYFNRNENRAQKGKGSKNKKRKRRSYYEFSEDEENDFKYVDNYE